MFNSLEEELHSKYIGARKYYMTFVKWFFLSIIVGAVCGTVGTAFFYCVSSATSVRKMMPWLIYFLPAAGMLIVFAYNTLGVEKDKGTNLVIRSVRSKEVVPLKVVFLIFMSTSITHLFGGSAGREGAALQIGGGIGAKIGSFFKLDERGLHILTMCGMSAVFSALFGTPITATIFSMEVISVGLMHYSAFVPCLFSSIIAYKIALYCGVEFEVYKILSFPNESLFTYGKVIVVGLVCAMVGVIFCETMHKFSRFIHSKIENKYLLAAGGGILIIILTLIVGNQDYNGAGTNIIEEAVSGNAVWYAFILKIVFTVITLSCGFKGGEIVPTFFIGSTLGCVLGPLLGLNASFSAALGLVGMFCAVVNCPIASLFLSIELFGVDRVLLFAVVCAVSYMMSGTYSLYSSQKIMYSKLEPEYINKNAK